MTLKIDLTKHNYTPWANIFCEAWPLWMMEHLIPVTLVTAASCRIMANRVVGISNPVSSRRDVNIQRRARRFHKHSQIVLYKVSSLNTVLHEICVTF